MNSDTITVQQLFQDKRQYKVPFYQRAYVWEKESQWRPLWNDVADKAETRLSGENVTPHFLGAIVLEPQPKPGLKGVETLNIIDGQQRLTTLQYFIASLAITARTLNAKTLVPVLEGCIWNSNQDTMEDADVEKFKVWPTFRDRENYELAMGSLTQVELQERFPSSFTQSATLKKIGTEHPLALEAIWFFCEQIQTWLNDEAQASQPETKNLESLAEAALRDFKVGSIVLGEGDDAQVIFETLNGRGAELHATDLIRNFIFMRADRDQADSASLYENLWKPFEGSFWNEDQRRGRLRRPRLEWFVQTGLQAETGNEIEVGNLYDSYRQFALPRKGEPLTAEKQLQLLNRNAYFYQQMVSGVDDSPIANFGKKINLWDVSSAHSIGLAAATSGIDEISQTKIFSNIISYIVRRAICGLTTKNYNKIFAQLLKKVRPQGITLDSVTKHLISLDGAASRWPRDDEFRQACLTRDLYGQIDASRLRAILIDLENGIRSVRTEEPFINSSVSLDIDHILPFSWYAHWKLGAGLVTAKEANEASRATFMEGEIPTRIKEIVKREQLKNTLGNLTLVHYGVNRSVQNAAFKEKRDALFASSNLHLNRELMLAEEWNERSIEERGRMLFDCAKKIWSFAN